MSQHETPAGERDEALAARLRTGDERAFEELHALYHRRVYAFALKRMRDASEAEDVTQDVFLQLYRSIDRYEGRSSLLTWIFGIAHHEICNRFRRRRLETASLDDEAGQLADPATPQDERIDASRALRQCSELLAREVTPAQRRVFAMRYVGSRSVGAIARETGKSAGAVRIGLLRTRRALREAAPELCQLVAG